MRFTSWLENLWRTTRRLDRRPRPALARSVDVLEDRTLLSVSTLFVNGELRVIADSGESVEVGTDVDGNVQVTVDGAVDTTVAPVPSASVEALIVIGGDLSNVLDLSGVQAADYSFQDINGNPLTVRVEAADGNDVITGPADLDVTVVAGDGDDTVTLLGGDNLVDAGDGDDSLLGGPGGDSLAGGDGHDTLSGGLGDDLITGDDGTDVVTGGDGQDSINGGDGPDLLDGGDGDDDINGESGRDTVIGGDGNDTLRGGGGNDELYGDTTDPLVISTGNDLVQGQGEDDTIIGGGGADVLQGGPGADLIRSTASDAQPPPPPQPPQPPQPPAPPPLPGFPDAVDSGGGTDSGTTHDMTNGPGDASLTITVNETGLFGTASGVSGDAGAIYDPVGPAPPAATTTFESELYFRDNTADPTGTRGLLGSLASNISTIRGLPTEANSTFTIGGLSFALTQAVTPMIDNSGVQTGSLLTQTLRFSNTGAAAIDFEFVRYIDGDLNFDGTLIDGGGRTVTGANEEVLFETDQGGSGTTDTTFVGITGKHGTEPASNRYEIDSFIGLQQRIAAGTALDDLISGDSDGDEFVDPGSEYDITLGLRNTFSLAPGGQDLWTTHTIFGSGAPSDVGAAGPSIPPVAVDDVGTTRANNRVVIDVVSNDSDPDGELDYSSVVIDSQPTNGTTVSLRDGRVSYSPAEGFVGTDAFNYTVADFDGTLSNFATVTVTVTPPDAGDTLNGGSGNDTMIASDGADRMFGGAGNDVLEGAFGNDSINGQGGNDSLLAGTGADLLVGGPGNDFLDSRTLSAVSIDDIRIDPEGDTGITPAVFTLTLSSPSDEVITVGYGTSSDGTLTGGTALAGLDYQKDIGSVTFQPGQTEATLTISVLGDIIDEVIEETFFVNLFDPTNAEVFDGLGEGRIIDDDDPPPGGLTVSPTLNETILVNALTNAGGAGLVVTGTTLSGNSLTSGEMSAGTFSVGATQTYGLSRSGVVLTSGDAANYAAGPDSSPSQSTGYGIAATPAQESLLDPITGGQLDHNDVTQLDIQFDMLPGFDTLFFDLVFGSEEWPVFVGSFNDGFGLYVNGVNIALVSGQPVNIDHPDMLAVSGTELNAVLAPNGDPRLQFSSVVGDGATGNTVTFIIGDVIDNMLDTTVYLSALGGSVPLAAPPPPPPVLLAGRNDTLLGRDGNDTLLAGEGFDLVNGGNQADSLHGGAGEDELYGGGGDDTLEGGPADDLLDGQGSNDLVFGNDGDDRLIWNVGGGSDVLDGGEGADVAEARGNDDDNTLSVLENTSDLLVQENSRLQVSDGISITTLEFSIPIFEVNGGAGDDTVGIGDLTHVPSLQVRVDGGQGNDSLSAAGADPGTVRLVFDGGADDDTITGSTVRDTIRGGDGNDQLFGDGGNDLVSGGDGDDVLDGQAGDDLLRGEVGFDTLDGNTGNDLLLGGDDHDSLLGGNGNDTLFGELGNDTLNGKSGDDSVLGGEGTDRLFGGNGNDTLDGGRDDDSLYGHNGDDRLLGDHGNDSLKGGRGNDTLIGGDGNDRMFGERDDDQLSGGDGQDTLNGASGDDILLGGDGDDTLLAGSGRDIVLGNLGDDYVKGQGGSRDTIAGGEGVDMVFGLASEIDENFSLPASLLADLDAV